MDPFTAVQLPRRVDVHCRQLHYKNTGKLTNAIAFYT